MQNDNCLKGPIRGRWWACISYDREQFVDILKSKDYAIGAYVCLHTQDEAKTKGGEFAHDKEHVKNGLVIPHWTAMIDTGRGKKSTRATLLRLLGEGTAYNDYYIQVNPYYFGPYLIHANVGRDDDSYNCTDRPCIDRPRKALYSVKDVICVGNVQPYEQFLEECMKQQGPQVPFSDFVHLCEFGDIRNFRELSHVLRRRYPHWLGAFADLDMRQQALLERIMRGDCRASQRVLWEGYDLFPFAAESEEEQAALDDLRSQQQVIFD